MFVGGTGVSDICVGLKDEVGTADVAMNVGGRVADPSSDEGPDDGYCVMNTVGNWDGDNDRDAEFKGERDIGATRETGDPVIITVGYWDGNGVGVLEGNFDAMSLRFGVGKPVGITGGK
jgi:hypothetical protein